jgi:hypothetical protein
VQISRIRFFTREICSQQRGRVLTRGSGCRASFESIGSSSSKQQLYFLARALTEPRSAEWSARPRIYNVRLPRYVGRPVLYLERHPRDVVTAVGVMLQHTLGLGKLNRI